MATVILGPAVLDIKGVRAGDRNLIQLTLKVDGIPVDLTGLTLLAQAREAKPDADPAVTAVITIIDAVAGVIHLRWPGDEVSLLFTGTATTWSGQWDLQVDDGTSDPITMVEGTFGAVLDVSR